MHLCRCMEGIKVFSFYIIIFFNSMTQFKYKKNKIVKYIKIAFRTSHSVKAAKMFVVFKTHTLTTDTKGVFLKRKT